MTSPLASSGDHWGGQTLQDSKFCVEQRQQVLGSSPQGSRWGRPSAGGGTDKEKGDGENHIPFFVILPFPVWWTCLPLGIQETVLIGPITQELIPVYPQAFSKISFLEHRCQTTSFPRVAWDIKSIPVSPCTLKYSQLLKQSLNRNLYWCHSLSIIPALNQDSYSPAQRFYTCWDKNWVIISQNQRNSKEATSKLSWITWQFIQSSSSSIFLKMYWGRKGYNDIPRTKSQPIWPKSFIQSKKPFILPCLLQGGGRKTS